MEFKWEDVRIGNCLLLSDKEGGTSKIVQVTKDMLLRVFQNEGSEYLREKFTFTYSAVVLTPELLLAAGFEENTHINGYKFYSFKNHKRNGFKFYATFWPDGVQLNSHYLPYKKMCLHELQNLFHVITLHELDVKNIL